MALPTPIPIFWSVVNPLLDELPPVVPPVAPLLPVPVPAPEPVLPAPPVSAPALLPVFESPPDGFEFEFGPPLPSEACGDSVGPARPGEFYPEALTGGLLVPPATTAAAIPSPPCLACTAVSTEFANTVF